MDAALPGTALEFFIVDDEEEVVRSDFVVQGGTDKEGDADLWGKGSDEFVVGHVFAVDGCLKSLVGENVNAEADIDRVRNSFSSTWYEKGKPCLEGVFEFGVGDIFGLDVIDAPINVLWSIDVNRVWHDDSATLVATGSGADTSVEDDGHAFMLSVRIISLYLTGGSGLEGHALGFMAQYGTPECIGVDDDFAGFLVDLFEIDDELGGVVTHEFVVEGIPAFTGVADVDFGGHVTCKDNVLGQVFNDDPIGKDDFSCFLNGLQEPEDGGKTEEDKEHRKIAVELNQSQSPEYHFKEVCQHRWDYQKSVSQMVLLLRLLGAFCIDVVTVYLYRNALGNFDGEV